MNKQTQTIREAMGTLAEDARSLMTATADVTGEKVGNARRRLASALESSKHLCGRAREKAVESAKAADQTVRENPYQAILIGIGVGALVGYIAGRHCSSSDSSLE